MSSAASVRTGVLGGEIGIVLEVKIYFMSLRADSIVYQEKHTVYKVQSTKTSAACFACTIL